MKYTPGPWRACGHEKGGCVCRAVWSVKADRPVASVEWAAEDFDRMPDEEAAADAFLIAAAPDMLEVAKEFVSMFVDTKKYPDPETVTTGLRILFPKAKAAIAKAEGK